MSLIRFFFFFLLFQPGDLIQITMLSTWLAELHLNHLGKLKENGASQGGEELKKAKENFQKFLAQVLIYSLIFNLLIFLVSTKF